VSQPTIRTIDASDASCIAQIYVDSWNMGFTGLMPARQLTTELVARWERDLTMPIPHRWWVAEVDTALVGFVGIGPSRDPIDPSLGELDTIAVAPTYWRRGIGRALLAMAMGYLRADGYRQAILWTLAHYAQGQRFYEAAGWRLDGGVRDAGRQVRYRHNLHTYAVAQIQSFAVVLFLLCVSFFRSASAKTKHR
jgi:ribosomal protein S18 acetylase RimI-like enzyme